MSVCDKQSKLGCATLRRRVKDVVWIKVDTNEGTKQLSLSLIDSYVMDVVSCFLSRSGSGAGLNFDLNQGFLPSSRLQINHASARRSLLSAASPPPLAQMLHMKHSHLFPLPAWNTARSDVDTLFALALISCLVTPALVPSSDLAPSCQFSQGKARPTWRTYH
jgi:hypothetical protein